MNKKHEHILIKVKMILDDAEFIAIDENLGSEIYLVQDILHTTIAHAWLDKNKQIFILPVYLKHILAKRVS